MDTRWSRRWMPLVLVVPAVVGCAAQYGGKVQGMVGKNIREAIAQFGPASSQQNTGPYTTYNWYSAGQKSYQQFVQTGTETIGVFRGGAQIGQYENAVGYNETVNYGTECTISFTAEEDGTIVDYDVIGNNCNNALSNL